MNYLDTKIVHLHNSVSYSLPVEREGQPRPSWFPTDFPNCSTQSYKEAVLPYNFTHFLRKGRDFTPHEP